MTLTVKSDTNKEKRAELEAFLAAMPPERVAEAMSDGWRQLTTAQSLDHFRWTARTMAKLCTDAEKGKGTELYEALKNLEASRNS